MLNSFYVENYKNVNMKDELQFLPGGSFIYGACSSGKTNLCIALADVYLNKPILNQRNKVGIKFRYGFHLLEQQIWFQYTRSKEGKAYEITLEIPHLFFTFQQKNVFIVR